MMWLADILYLGIYGIFRLSVCKKVSGELKSCSDFLKL